MDNDVAVCVGLLHINSDTHPTTVLAARTGGQTRVFMCMSSQLTKELGPADAYIVFH